MSSEPSGASSAAAACADAGHAAAAAAVGSEIAVASLTPTAGEGLSLAIQRMKKEQMDLRRERKRVAKELRNAQKRASRLKKRARQLTDGDLLEVLRMRGDAAAASGTTSAPDTPQAEPNASPEV